MAPVTLAAADSSAARQTGSIQTLLLVIIGALSLAGLMGSAIFRFGRMRWTGRRDVRGDRRAMWDSAGPSPMAYSSSRAPMPAADIRRERRAADDPNRRITEMLARLSRSAAN
jgi:LPXTG-motif cell wall-anchored protein